MSLSAARLPGADGKTIEAFGNHLDEEIARLRAAWKAGTDRPQAIRRVWIPKPGRDEQRPLGIPTLRDRVVQTALKLVLEPIFESTFSNHSHGFRPGRSARDALVAVLSHLEAGKVRVVDVDLKAYFDGISHERLLAVVRRKVTDRRVLDLIGAFLEAGVLDEAESTSPEAGTLQGGVRTPPTQTMTAAIKRPPAASNQAINQPQVSNNQRSTRKQP